MALITYTLTDTTATFDVGCSGRSAGITTNGVQANDGGTQGAGSSEGDPGNNGTNLACVSVLCGPAPGVATWADGTWSWTIPFPSSDPGTTLEEVHLCDWDGATTYTTIASTTGIAHGTASGSYAWSQAQGGDHTPQSEANSQPFIVLVFSNTDDHGGSAIAVGHTTSISSPIDDGAVAGSTHIYLPLLGVG